MITSKKMAVADANAAYLGLSTAKLMENAGAGVARKTVEGIESDNLDVLILSGRGNNGGDAMVAARFLNNIEGVDAELLLMGRSERITTEITADNYRVLENSMIDVAEVRDSTGLEDRNFGEYEVLVDGMLGTGVKGGLREPVASATEKTNAARDEGSVKVVSIDVPTGLDPDRTQVEVGDQDCVNPDLVVTFHDYKPIHQAIKAEVTLVDIGIPDAATRYVGEGDLDLIRREIDSHKGENGEILVVGGGPYTGAPALTSMAALRSGCDLVRVACPESVADRIQGYSPNLITHSLTGNVITGDNVEKIIGIGEGCDSVVLGPGLGDADETVEAAGELIEAMDRLVVDADAITAVDGVDTDGKDVLITPHAGELGQFVEVPENLEGRTEVVKEFSKDRGLVTLLKGRNDVVSDGDDVRISRTGNPGMTVGGTGDVLAGISGFLSTQIDLMDAGCIAAFVNGRAGDEAFDCYGDGLTANDVIDKVPVAFEDR